MKKLFAVVMAIALAACLTSYAYGAAATVTETEYGYSITGGTDETLVKADLIRIKMIAYTGLTAANTVRLRSGAVSGTSWYMKAVATSDAAGSYIYFGEYGALFSCLSVTLTSAQDVVQIYNK